MRFKIFVSLLYFSYFSWHYLYYQATLLGYVNFQRLGCFFELQLFHMQKFHILSYCEFSTSITNYDVNKFLNLLYVSTITAKVLLNTSVLQGFSFFPFNINH